SALVLYARSAMEGMRTGYFSYLAHPDLMFINDFGMDDNCRKAISIIIDEAEKKDYILELNANGFRRGKWKFAEGVRYPYPADAFWEEAAKAGIRVIIGSDCHSPCKLNDEYILETEQYAKKLGLQMIDRI
ncbi:MAG TPA: histidinol-phosphatase, partial [Lachnospiraceae bacterium]|nr:histidinol-phosphatase [Lachnospiraceae bacterium]